MFKNLSAIVLIESLIILGLGIGLWSALSVQTETTIPTDIEEESVHLHADLRMVLDGRTLDFNQERYFERDEGVHFHAGSVPVVHVEEEGIAWGDFLATHGMTLEDACLSLETGERYCAGEGKELRFFINNVRIDTFADLPIADLQRVLIFFGSPDEKTVQAELGKVTADACVQSGNCFGRDEEEAKAAELESGCTGTEPCRE